MLGTDAGTATTEVDTNAVAARARRIVMNVELKLGFEPTDRELEKLGYDIESRVPGTGKLRFIEVKGRRSDAATITVTRNEILYSLKQPDSFILAIVELRERRHAPGPLLAAALRPGARPGCRERELRDEGLDRSGRSTPVEITRTEQPQHGDNHRDRVGKALETLRAGLGPFVDREVRSALKKKQIDETILVRFTDNARTAKQPVAEWDVAALLKLMTEQWHQLFRSVLGHAERSFVSELRDHRNRWAHQEAFSGDDVYRVLDTTARLLTAISAPQAADTDKLKMELLRVRFDEQARGERRKQASLTIESPTAHALKPWREIATPHQDVASGRYQQAEFAPISGRRTGRGKRRVPGPGRVLPTGPT